MATTVRSSSRLSDLDADPSTCHPPTSHTTTPHPPDATLGDAGRWFSCIEEPFRRRALGACMCACACRAFRACGVVDATRAGRYMVEFLCVISHSHNQSKTESPSSGGDARDEADSEIGETESSASTLSAQRQDIGAGGGGARGTRNLCIEIRPHGPPKSTISCTAPRIRNDGPEATAAEGGEAATRRLWWKGGGDRESQFPRVCHVLPVRLVWPGCSANKQLGFRSVLAFAERLHDVTRNLRKLTQVRHS